MHNGQNSKIKQKKVGIKEIILGLGDLFINKQESVKLLDTWILEPIILWLNLPLEGFKMSLPQMCHFGTWITLPKSIKTQKTQEE